MRSVTYSVYCTMITTTPSCTPSTSTQPCTRTLSWRATTVEPYRVSTVSARYRPIKISMLPIYLPRDALKHQNRRLYRVAQKSKLLIIIAISLYTACQPTFIIIINNNNNNLICIAPVCAKRLQWRWFWHIPPMIPGCLLQVNMNEVAIKILHGSVNYESYNNNQQ